MQYFVYILRCSDGSYYTGITTDLEKRIESHNNGVASKYTSPRRPVELVFHERCNDKSSATKREIEIKKLPRTEKERLF